MGNEEWMRRIPHWTDTANSTTRCREKPVKVLDEVLFYFIVAFNINNINITKQ